ncbi:MAG: tetratricopeptide repeat protein, partial [Candidatus Latescibacterota bacterium]
SALPSDAQTPETARAGRSESERNFDSSITVPELFEKARGAFGLNKFDLAVDFYQEILIRDRANVQAMLELANVYERSGKLEYARGLLVRSAKIVPDNQDIADRLAAVEHMLSIVLSAEVDSLLDAKQYELAIPKLSVHLSIEPGNPELLYKKALCYSHLGRPDAALSAINEAIQIDQKQKYYELRDNLLDDLKHLETEEKVAEAKKLIQSGDPGDRDRAIGILGEILSINPDHAWARAEFVRLSEDGAAPADTLAESGVRDLARDAFAVAVRASGFVVEIIRRHLTAILLLVVALLVFRSPLTRRITRMLTPRPFLSGKFPRFSLTEILIMLNSESHTGVLQVKGDGCRGKIYIENGEPCHCSVGKLHGVKALHHLLSNTNSGRFEFVDGSLPLNRTIDTPLTIVLVDQSYGGPGRAAKKRAAAEATAKKPKSRMKELLESKPD